MSAGPLSDRDVHAVASAVARGDQPRVAALAAVEAADVAAGTRGVVVAYDPDAAEPFTVRFGTDGDAPEVHLPPSALTVVPRTRSEILARTATPASGPTPDTGAAGSAPDDGPGAGTTDRAGRGAAGSDSDGGAGSGADASTGDASKDGASAKDGAGSPGGAGTNDGAAGARKGADNGRPRAAEGAGRKAKAARPARKGRAADVVITVTVAGDGASVEATHGTRKLVKGASLPVAAGHALARAIDMAPVTDAVEAVIAEHRAAKQAEADELRDRLAALERELAQYTETDEATAPAAAD